MTEQEKAIRHLERALKECGDAGLWIFGMDGNLEAYRAEDLLEIGRANDAEPTSYRVRSLNQDLIIPIDDHGAYIDSGGW